MVERPRISVIIPARNAVATLGPLLAALRTTAYYPHEILVIDDASTDATADIARQYGATLIECSTRGGPSVARNLGAALATGEIFLFLDADVVPAGDIISRVAQRFEDPSVQVLTGIFAPRPANDGFFPKYKALYYHWLARQGGATGPFETACGAIRRELFFRAGGFDERYRDASVEDFEFGHRVSRWAAVLVDRELQFAHHFPLWRVNARKYWSRTIGWMRLFWRRRRFESSYETPREAINAVVCAASMLGAFAGVWHPAGWWVTAVAAAVYTMNHAAFLRFAAQTYGGRFAVAAWAAGYVNFSILGGAAGAGTLAACVDGACHGWRRLVLAGRTTAALAWGVCHPNHPSYVILYVNSRCNAKCKMCFYWRTLDGPPRHDLSLEELTRIARSVRPLVQLTLSGGEPFLRHDLPDIVDIFKREAGVRTVTLITNGSLPPRVATAVRGMLERHPDVFFTMAISVDGVGPVHDEIRGLPRSFEQLLETYRLLRRLRGEFANCRLNITSVMSAYNKHHLRELFEFVAEHLDVDDHELLLARGDAREASSKEVAISEYAAAVRLWNERNRKPNRYPVSIAVKAVTALMMDTLIQTVTQDRAIYPCLSGKKMIIITEEGLVKPCEILPEQFTLGDLRADHLDVPNLLRTPHALEVKRYIKETGCHCSFECAQFNNLIFSPRAYPRFLRYVAKEYWKELTHANN